MYRILTWAGFALLALVAALILGPIIYSVIETPSAEPIRLDHTDPAFKALEQAERSFFAQYGIDNYKVHYVELEDMALRVRVIEAGTGPTLILIPGGQGEVGELVDLIAHLPEHRVLAINRPGGGGSDGVDFRAVGMHRVAIATLTAVYDHFELDRTSIVGNSMGGLWAFWYALEQPEDVSSLVQLGSPAIVEGTGAVLPLRLLAVPGLNRLLIQVAKPSSAAAIREDAQRLGHSEQVSRNWPQERLEYMYRVRQLPTFEVTMPALAEEMLRPLGPSPLEPDAVLRLETLANVEQPTLLIWGSRDPYGTLAAARDIEAALPNGQLQQVGVGHHPWWDEPETTARLLREFLAGKDIDD